MTSITIVVGSGWPGHAAIQIKRGDATTYVGLGPQAHRRPYHAPNYDIVTLPNGVSPVAALRNPIHEYHYVDARLYPVKSFTLQISERQADAAISAAMQYREDNPKYNVFNRTVCTDYALSVLKAAIPGAYISTFSRFPNHLIGQLDAVVKNGNGILAYSIDPAVPTEVVDTGLKGLKQDSDPPNFNLWQQFNDKVPFNFASGEVGISGQPRETKAQVSLTRAGDGSGELSVGDSTFVKFEPGQLASVANSDGKLRLSFSRDGSRDRFFGNVMAVDTGTGDVSVLDKHGKLSNLEAGSRISITSAGWDHASEVKPNDLERAGSERMAGGFG